MPPETLICRIITVNESYLGYLQVDIQKFFILYMYLHIYFRSVHLFTALKQNKYYRVDKYKGDVQVIPTDTYSFSSTDHIPTTSQSTDCSRSGYPKGLSA